MRNKAFIFLVVALTLACFSSQAQVTETVWVDDSIPEGASPGADGGDSWNWVSSNPTPFSGSLAHASALASGLHQHYFDWAHQTLAINSGDVMFAYIYLDPANPPSQVMLEWNNGTWEHRAYWGADKARKGANGTPGYRYVGPLPPAGQWVRLEVPASQVDLEGSNVRAMSFTLFDGRAIWDKAGKASGSLSTPPTNNPGNGSSNTPPVHGTNPGKSATTNALLPGSSIVDNLALQMPKVGDHDLKIISPTLVELKYINTKPLAAATVTDWNWVNNFQANIPSASSFVVTANGQNVAVSAVGFKRRPLYAPLVGYDLRVENSIYLQLATPLSDNQKVEVTNPSKSLWGTNLQFSATMDPLRYNPAIHVNQEGYMPNLAKKAMVGYYLGSLGELNVVPTAGFKLVDDASGITVFSGNLVQRADSGFIYTPTPYQKVYEADFTSFTTPGRYRLVVPGMGSSTPFNINEGIAMNFARAYALGLYHQRCGTDNSMPHTRHTHDACHVAPVEVPFSASEHPFVWNTIAGYAVQTNPDNPVQTAPLLTSPSAQLFPFVNKSSFNAAGGHHDAGDYSKYTINSASFVHYLMFAVDSMAGVAALDNLGLPESGDGISDVLQEAKWEADFLAKIQDADGGFYFLVYPKNREYEGDVTPDRGDPQIVYPKTTSSTAAAVAALAQCASSPEMKRAYPQAAALYLEKAKLGWQFLTNAVGRYGKTGAYQKITHYGDDFADQDELAWAAAEMFVATGDPAIHQTLMSWFPDPANPATFRWGWWRLYGCYGNAVRSYGFAVKSGRLQAHQVNASYLAKCQQVIVAAGDDATRWSNQGAYGSSFPEATKHVQGAGWYFSSDQAYDITTAYQLSPKPEYLTAILANMNYEGGCNPVNVSYISGIGWKQHRDIVHQYACNDRRVMPPSGIPIGNIQSGFQYLGSYQGALRALCYPEDKKAGYPYYDRWGDSWNVENEFVILNSARSLGSLAFMAAQSGLKNQAWKSATGTISVPTSIAIVGSPVTVSLQASGIDLSNARITWEARDQEPAMGATYTFTPKNNGVQWVEAEALLPDGRRMFATAEFKADSPDIVWFDDDLPEGAVSGGVNGDSWDWISTPVKSGTKAHQSAAVAGLHQHHFDWAGSTLTVGTGTILYAYVYLDPANPPTAIMLQWNDGTWDHRAFWGADVIPWGTPGTTGRRAMGDLPPTGQWVQLKVPAAQVGLEGSVVKGMAFSTYDGRSIWDAAGLLNPSVTNSNPSNGSGSTNSGLPTVSITAVDGSAAGNKPGVFTFTRTGNTTGALSVAYSLAGTAARGTDYTVASAAPAIGEVINVSTVTIPAGASSANLSISPLLSNDLTEPRTVVATVAPSANYEVTAPGTATVVIAGNAVNKPALKMSASGPTLSWASDNGAAYRIAYKDRLDDPEWTYLPGTVTSAGTTTSWTDTAKKSQRFYMIIRVQ